MMMMSSSSLQTAAHDLPGEVGVLLAAMGVSRVSQVRMADVDSQPADFRAEFRRVLELAVAARRARREQVSSELA